MRTHGQISDEIAFQLRDNSLVILILKHILRPSPINFAPDLFYFNRYLFVVSLTLASSKSGASLPNWL